MSSASTITIPSRELGHSGLKVSCLGFGCMGLTCGYGSPDSLTEKDNINIIREAFRLGVTFFDTAYCYSLGVNEELLGRAIATLPRGELVIATKCGLEPNAEGMYVCDSHPDTIRRSIDGSLQRLGVSYIDLLYVHRVDPAVPIEDVARTMLEQQKAGKIRHWGLSEASVATIRKAHAICPLTAVQSEYSIIHRLPELELFPALEELGIGFVPFSPLGSGFLTATISPETKFDPSDLRAIFPKFTPANIAANAPVIALVKEFAEKKSATPAQIALAWVVAQRSYIAPIPGTTKVHRLQENMGAVSVHFTPEELKDFNDRLDRIQVHGARYPPALMAMVETPDDVIIAGNIKRQ